MKIHHEKARDKKGWIWFVGKVGFPESFRAFNTIVNAQKYYKTFPSTQVRYLMQLPIQEKLYD